MRRKWTLSGLLLLMSVTGCSSMNNTEKGVVGGAAVGTVLGTAVGIATRNPAAGAAVGGVLGAGVGGMVGADQDRREVRERYAQDRAIAVANATRNQMSMREVINLAQRGIQDDIIIQQINSTNSVFALTSDDVIELQQSGVSPRVISYMQQRRTLVVVPSRPVVVAPPPPYYYDPGPRVVVGVGGRF